MNIYSLKYTDSTTKSSNHTGTFPKIWEMKQPTIDKYVMQKLIELEQKVKELKEEIKRLKNGTH